MTGPTVPAGEAPDGPAPAGGGSQRGGRGEPRGAGVWIPRPSAPLVIPGAHAAVWADGALVAWGGDGRVAVYALATRRWQRLPDGPLEPRLGPALVWTGSEVLVWGGERRDGRPAQDGAALDPASGRWERLPEAPVGLRRPVVAWTGSELLVWGRSEPDGAVAGAALDLRSGRWRLLPDAPVTTVGVADGLWTGSELVVYGRAGGGERFAAAYRPGRDAWRRLRPPPLAHPGRAASAWTGEELVLWGRRLAGQDRPAVPPAGAALDPARNRWRLLPAAPGYDRPGTSRGLHGLRAAWTGRRVIVVGGYPGSAALAYDPDADTWERLAALPGVLHPVVVWTGAWRDASGTRRSGELLLWGGYGPYGPTADLRSWRTVGLSSSGDGRLRTGS